MTLTDFITKIHILKVNSKKVTNLLGFAVFDLLFNFVHTELIRVGRGGKTVYGTKRIFYHANFRITIYELRPELQLHFC